MKKLLLSVATLAAIITTNAQSKYVIYDGSATDILVGNAYGFNGFEAPAGMVKSDSTFMGNTFWYLEGSVDAAGKYYVGGTGNANFQTLPVLATSFGLNITQLLGATFSFNYVSDVEVNADFDLEQQLLSARGTDSTILIGTTNINMPATTLPVLSTITKPLSAFAKGGVALTAEDFAKVSKITIKISLTTEKGTVKAAFDDITVTDGTTTSVSDDVINNFKNEVVTVYNITGSVVATGDLETLNLQSGFYILKSASKTQKVVIK